MKLREVIYFLLGQRILVSLWSVKIEDAVRKYRLIYLGVGEAALRSRAFSDIFKSLEITPKDFDVAVFDSGLNPSSWILESGIPPFFAERKVVVVHNIFAADLKSLNVDSLKNIPESGLLILMVDDEVGDYEAERKRTTLDGQWAATINKADGYATNFEIKSNQRADLIREEAQRYSKKMSPKAIDVLLEMVGNDLSLAIGEIDKLAIFAGKESEIRESAVRDVVISSPEWNVFQMLDAVVAGNSGEALRQLRILLGSTNKPEDVAFRQILPLLSRRISLVWQARICLDHKIYSSPFPTSVSVHFPERPNLGAEKQFSQGKLLGAAKMSSIPKLSKMTQLLADADARLKGAIPHFSGVDTLERLVIDMCKVQ